MNKSEGLDTEYEPYFESEDVSELGYSFENAVCTNPLVHLLS